MGYSAMIAQGRALSKKEKAKKATPSRDDMVSSLLSDLEENPYAQHYGREAHTSLMEPSRVYGRQADTTPVAPEKDAAPMELNTAATLVEPEAERALGDLEKATGASLGAHERSLAGRGAMGTPQHEEQSEQSKQVSPAKSDEEARPQVDGRGHTWLNVDSRGHTWPNVDSRDPKSPNVDSREQSWTVQMDTRGQSWTVVDSPNGQSKRTVVDSREQSWTHVDSRGQSRTVVDSREPLNTAMKMDSHVEPKDAKQEPASPTKEQDSTPILNKIAEHNVPFKTASQRTLAAYLKALGSHITSHATISNETGLSLGTLRRQLRNFQAWGMIKTERHYGYRNAQGMRLTVFTIPSIPEPVHFFQKNLPTDDVISSQKMDSREDEKWTVVNSREKKSQAIHDCPRLSISPLLDRKKESIYLSKQEDHIELSPLLSLNSEDIAFSWPNLAMIDFGESQIRQIFERLVKLGKDPLACTESVRQGLSHADAALSLGKLMDHKGVEVTDPRAYIFRALARDGYYAAPKGYVSPEAQRLRDETQRVHDEAEQARLLSEAQKCLAEQQAAVQTQQAEDTYTLWRSQLSAQELEDIKGKSPAHVKGATAFEKWLQLVYFPSFGGIS